MTSELRVDHPALSTFLGHLGGVAVSVADPVALIQRTLDPFRHLLMENFLPDDYRDTPSTHVSRYVLFRSADHSLNLMLSVIPSKHKTPIHDHGALWGLAGIYQGTAREVSYSRDTERSTDGTAIKRSTRRTLKPGDIAAILPPDMDIHTMEATSDMPVVVLMLLASGPDDPERYIYDSRRHTRSLANDHYEDHY